MICGDDSHVCVCDIHGEQDVYDGLVPCGVNQIRWKVFIVGIGLNNLISLNGIHNLTPRDAFLRESHIDMVRPIHSLRPDTPLNKFQRVFRHPVFGTHVTPNKWCCDVCVMPPLTMDPASIFNSIIAFCVSEIIIHTNKPKRLRSLHDDFSSAPYHYLPVSFGRGAAQSS